MEVRIAKRGELKEIARLSEVFASEGCCNNIYADDEEYFICKNTFVALENDEIIGYAYGIFGEEVYKRSYAMPKDVYFELEEMYVLPQYRNKNVGQKLFCEVENFAIKNGAKTLRLNAVSKNYKSLLNFYIDKLNMQFISAFLVKKL